MRLERESSGQKSFQGKGYPSSDGEEDMVQEIVSQKGKGTFQKVRLADSEGTEQNYNLDDTPNEFENELDIDKVHLLMSQKDEEAMTNLQSSVKAFIPVQGEIKNSNRYPSESFKSK